MDEARPRIARLDVYGWAIVVGLVSLLALRLAGVEGTLANAFESASFWIYLPAWPVLLGALATKRLRLFAVASVIAAVHLAMCLPGAIPRNTADATAPRWRLRVASANLLAGNAEMGALAEELRVIEADVLALEELTPEHVAALERAGVLALYPHRVLEPQTDCFGIGLLSKYPFTARVEPLEGVPMIVARLEVPIEVTVIAAHTLPPMSGDYTARWRRQLGTLRERALRAPGSVIVLGDLNVSPYARAYGDLVEAPLRDAHDELGRGLTTTWPNGTTWLPPMRLDHVLVRGDIDVLDVREGEGAGSDHEPLIAEIALR